MLKFYNTLSRKKEVFRPLKDKKVGLYTCGPTVYWYAHIGNLRSYLFEDILRKVLEYNNYKVKHVMNITDVGHLTSDADTGEDKVEKEAKKERKTAREIANFYEKAFRDDLKLLNIKEPDVFVKATETIKNQISLIKTLEKKGFTYKIADGVYFDTSKLKTYGKLWPKKMKIKAGARVKMVRGKRSPTDFALWKFTPTGVKRQMEWDSPWGKGFPGWHTECVVMSVKHLGIPFDIHTGGIDHVLIHHTNEIAQAEAVYKKILARYWLHGEFLILREGRMGKSERNIIILSDLAKKEIDPLVYRYLCLTTHYRSKLTFSWESLKGTQNALKKLYQKTAEIKSNKALLKSKRAKDYQKRFLDFINEDLNMPRALALIWEIIEDKNLSDKEIYALLIDFDKILGLGLKEVKKEKISKEILKLTQEREKYRTQKNWQKADEVRKRIQKLGFQVEDTKQGSKIKKFD